MIIMDSNKNSNEILQELDPLDRAIKKLNAEKKSVVNKIEGLESELMQMKKEELELLILQEYHDECTQKTLTLIKSKQRDILIFDDDDEVIEFQLKLSYHCTQIQDGAKNCKEAAQFYLQYLKDSIDKAESEIQELKEKMNKLAGEHKILKKKFIKILSISLR